MTMSLGWNQRLREHAVELIGGVPAPHMGRTLIGRTLPVGICPSRSVCTTPAPSLATLPPGPSGSYAIMGTQKGANPRKCTKRGRHGGAPTARRASACPTCARSALCAAPRRASSIFCSVSLKRSSMLLKRFGCLCKGLLDILQILQSRQHFIFDDGSQTLRQLLLARVVRGPSAASRPEWVGKLRLRNTVCAQPLHRYGVQLKLGGEGGKLEPRFTATPARTTPREDNRRCVGVPGREAAGCHLRPRHSPWRTRARPRALTVRAKQSPDAMTRSPDTRPVVVRTTHTHVRTMSVAFTDRENAGCPDDMRRSGTAGKRSR